MGKYDDLEDKTNLLRKIANELGESNRIKRLELRIMAINWRTKSDRDKWDKDLEDQA